MLVSEIMSRNIEIINPDFTLKQAAQKMSDLDIGYLPVGENDRLVGTITDRDITVRGTAKGLDPNKTKIRNLMTKKVFYCFEDQTIDEACKIMKDNEIRRITVLSRDKRAVGVCSIGDIANLSGDDTLNSEVLECVSAHHFSSF